MSFDFGKPTAVTYFPLATQQQLAKNRAAVKDKLYAKYFNDDLWIYDHVLPALKASMPRDKALPFTPEALNSLLEPGYAEHECGHCELEDGGAFISSVVPFPNCPTEAFAWWFWWHAVEHERYMLWYPSNHISADSNRPDKLLDDSLPDVERYIGTWHRVTEFVGPVYIDAWIEFVDPKELGFDTSRFGEAGIVGHACARLWASPKIQIGAMVHLARKTPGNNGFELRSRYWIGHDLTAHWIPRLPVKIDGALRALGIKKRLLGDAELAYEQLLHDQIEFTHLSTFLADIYAEFGPSARAK